MPNELDAVALEVRVKALTEAGLELADLMDAIVEGDYKPDSFTTQPMRAALASAKPAQAGEYEGLYLAAVKGRQDFRDAFRKARARANAAEARVLSLETRLAAMGEALEPFAPPYTQPNNPPRGVDEEAWAADVERARAILSTEASHHG